MNNNALRILMTCPIWTGHLTLGKTFWRSNPSLFTITPRTPHTVKSLFLLKKWRCEWTCILILIDFFFVLIFLIYVTYILDLIFSPLNKSAPKIFKFKSWPVYGFLRFVNLKISILSTIFGLYVKSDTYQCSDWSRTSENSL